MLPAETFSEVVSFLGYYDLGGLKLSSKLLSAVADECARTIRLFDFSGFIISIFEVFDETFTIVVERLDSLDWVCTLKFETERDIADFISEAFCNCTVGRFHLRTDEELVLNAVKAVANTVTVRDLFVPYDLRENVQELIDFVDSFRRVKV
ncbi:hypothetical protein AAVH_17264 [Aphelenchoides avenae]|nr:hypothetical protein AAVH_17264 [Aphelenchus avenae]